MRIRMANPRGLSSRAKSASRIRVRLLHLVDTNCIRLQLQLQCYDIITTTTATIARINIDTSKRTQWNRIWSKSLHFRASKSWLRANNWLQIRIRTQKTSLRIKILYADVDGEIVASSTSDLFRRPKQQNTVMMMMNTSK